VRKPLPRGSISANGVDSTTSDAVLESKAAQQGFSTSAGKPKHHPFQHRYRTLEAAQKRGTAAIEAGLAMARSLSARSNQEERLPQVKRSVSKGGASATQSHELGSWGRSTAGGIIRTPRLSREASQHFRDQGGASPRGSLTTNNQMQKLPSLSTPRHSPSNSPAVSPRSSLNPQDAQYAGPSLCRDPSNGSMIKTFSSKTARSRSRSSSRPPEIESDDEVMGLAPSLPIRSLKNFTHPGHSSQNTAMYMTGVKSTSSSQDSGLLEGSFADSEDSTATGGSSPSTGSSTEKTLTVASLAQFGIGSAAPSPVDQPQITSSLSSCLAVHLRSPVATGLSATKAEVDTFRSYLSKRFGNLTRAWQQLQMHSHSSAQSAGERSGSARRQMHQERLDQAQFEEIIIGYLKYGDCRLAQQLFRALGGDERDGIGLAELADTCNQGGKGVLSLVDFRRMLQQRHASLAHAFRELEDFLLLPESDGTPSTYSAHRGELFLEDFMQAAGFYGLEEHQAVHCFRSMDAKGVGFITVEEFLKAMTSMPRRVLLQDFRNRLIKEDPRLSVSLRQIMDEARVPDTIRKSEFCAALARMGIVEVEAANLFDIMDKDRSRSISSRELFAAVREGAPPTSCDDFWRRLSGEWPLLVAVAHHLSSGTRQRVGAMLAELLHEEQVYDCSDELSPMGRHLLTDGSTGFKLDCMSVPHSVPVRAVTTVTFEIFDLLAAPMDVTPEDSRRVFERMAGGCPRVAILTQRLQEDFQQPDEIYMDLDDFIEELRLRTSLIPQPPPREQQPRVASRSGTRDMSGDAVKDKVTSEKKQRLADFRRARTVQALSNTTTKQLAAQASQRKNATRSFSKTLSKSFTQTLNDDDDS